MKHLLLLCASLVAGTPILQGRSLPTSVFDYYDFVEIPRVQPMASDRSDGPLRGPVARPSANLPRRIPLPVSHPRRPPPAPLRSLAPFSEPRPHHPGPLREPDYQLASSDIYQPRHQPRPKVHQGPRPHHQPRPQKLPLRDPEPQFFDYQERRPALEEEILYPVEETLFVEQPQFYQEEGPANEDVIEQYDQVSPLYQEERRPQYKEERRPQPDRRPHHQEERRPQHQEERRPQHQEERRPQHQEERRPHHQEERRPPYKEQRQPQYQEERPQFFEEKRPEYQAERRPQYQEEKIPQYQEERPPQYQEERLPQNEPTSEKVFNSPSQNIYRKPHKETEPVKEKRDAIHSDGHLDANGVQFAANAAEVENAKGAGRLAFQIHGQQGPHSYRFGYDTGKGHNRQFRYEERDGHGQVHGRYGFYGKDGKLQVVNYSAHPEHGFSADVPH